MNKIKIVNKIHRLPGVDDVDYLYNRSTRELVIKIGEIEIKRLNNGEALRVYSLATDDGFMDMETLAGKVCRFFRVTDSQFFSKTRKREVVDARSVFVRFVRETTKNNTSYQEIGRFLRRDHATMLWAHRNCKEVPELINMYRNFKYWLEKGSESKKEPETVN